MLDVLVSFPVWCKLQIGNQVIRFQVLPWLWRQSASGGHLEVLIDFYRAATLHFVSMREENMNLNSCLSPGKTTKRLNLNEKRKSRFLIRMTVFLPAKYVRQLVKPDFIMIIRERKWKPASRQQRGILSFDEAIWAEKIYGTGDMFVSRASSFWETRSSCLSKKQTKIPLDLRWNMTPIILLQPGSKGVETTQHSTRLLAHEVHQRRQLLIKSAERLNQGATLIDILEAIGARWRFCICTLWRVLPFQCFPHDGNSLTPIIVRI